MALIRNMKRMRRETLIYADNDLLLLDYITRTVLKEVTGSDWGIRFLISIALNF